VIGALGLAAATAWADPVLPPPWLLEDDARRTAGESWLAGASPLGPETPGGDGDWNDFEVRVRPWTRAAGGNLEPRRTGGDTEPGLASWRGGLEIGARSSWLELRLSPEVRVDAPAEPDWLGAEVLAAEYFGGLHREGLRLGFGAERRMLGPGRRGSLVLADHARPHPAGIGSWEGEVGKLGRIRGEGSVGWLQAPREDVQRPGLMLMDLRYSPVPALEVGASRMTLFGGVGRPMPTVGELLWPMDPHVENDPNQELADQDELAAVDLRVSLPLAQWVGGPVDWVEGWYQYGGEDMIIREVGGVSVPSLAGVANLYGGEVGAKGFVLTVERAEIFDDVFRWYTGHRVYHAGFTQSGRSLGHPVGGDARTLWMGLRWGWGPLGAQGWVEQLERIGVVEQLNGTLFTLATPETSWRMGARVWRLEREGGHLEVSYVFETLEGAGFVPGENATAHRIQVGRTGASRDALQGP
jgi:hypothetical protein